MRTSLKHIIVIGASAGGLQAIHQVVAALPADLPIAVFIVTHLSKISQADIITDALQKQTSYICRIPQDGETIQAGHIYLAPADQHLFVKRDSIRLLSTPHENRWRPSIDVLFRSAAAAYGSAVTGIILSGMLDDGTSGMSAIHRSGGICIVQEPEEAVFKDMPKNVLNNVPVDHRVPVADIGYIIADTLSKPRDTDAEIPEDVKREAGITERMSSAIDALPAIGTHSEFSCPDCGGNLWLIEKDAVPRYRCHTGHVYTGMVLLEKQGDALEGSVWTAIRLLEERKNLLTALDKKTGDKTASSYQERINDLEAHIDRLKKLLVGLSKNEIADSDHL